MTVNTLGHVHHAIALTRHLASLDLDVHVLCGDTYADILRNSLPAGRAHAATVFNVDFRKGRGGPPHLVTLLDPELLASMAAVIEALIQRLGVEILVAKDSMACWLVSDHLDIPLINFFSDGIESLLSGYRRQTLPPHLDVDLRMRQAATRLGWPTPRHARAPFVDCDLALARGLPAIDYVENGRELARRQGSTVAYCGLISFDGDVSVIERDAEVVHCLSKHPIYVTLGTVHSDPSAVAVIAAAARGLGRPVLVANPAARWELSGLRDVVGRDFLPNSAVLERAGLVVHHGGFGTTVAAVRAGIPQVIIPDNPRTSQEFHALALARVGAGALAPIGSIRESIQWALRPVVRKRAIELAEECRAQEQVEKAHLRRSVAALG